jgi:hypothetical protein
MGCLHTQTGFKHWFGNIHLSGNCNRACYFCIGQYMQGLDPLNNLNTWPLKGLNEFIDKCVEHGVSEINVTGTNTDPLLFTHTAALKQALQQRIPNLIFGIRTNGAASEFKKDVLKLYDKGSITICSFNKIVHTKMMGTGKPFRIYKDLEYYKHFTNLKVNCVLGPENALFGYGEDLFQTLWMLEKFGIKRVNLREPYGQPNIGDPIKRAGENPIKYILGMPVYKFKNMDVCYWDVHYVEVESVNLYADGKVSLTYPITKGYNDVLGDVKPQSEFKQGRNFSQWNK